MFTAKIYISPKKSVLDPQGKAVHRALESLGFEEIKSVRVGKFIEIQIDEKSKSSAEDKVKEMCEKLLANTVVEEFTFEIENT